MTDDAPAPIPAATLIVMRPGGEGPPEMLFVQRAQGLVFAGGALVFPGGRVDPVDRALATRHADPETPAHDETAHRIAAIRETIEEAGIAIGVPLDQASVARVREGLHAGRPFDTLLEAEGAEPDPEALVPFARWLPDRTLHRVFDARFYLAQLPPGAPEPTIDNGENVRAFWATARAVLEMAASGDATVIYPTRRNLERLARFESFDGAVADAGAHPVRAITPWVERRDGADHLCIPEDCGYPVTAERLDRALRA